MGFDPNGFARAVPNTSDGFDYYENNASRLTIASHCTGTAIRDFVNVADESSFDEEFVVELFGAPPADAMLVFGSPDQK